MTTSPGILVSNPITLDVDIDDFDFQSISDVLWETVSIDVPVEPVITLPTRPDIEEPVAPIAPDINLDPFVEQELQSLEVETACQDRVDIVMPGKLTLPEWTEDVPTFADAIPTGVVDWQYEEFSYALHDILMERYDLLLLPTEYVARFQEREAAVWSKPQDLVGQRGEVNPYYTRFFANNSLLSRAADSWTVITDYKNLIALKKLFIQGRQANEKILSQHHDVEQKLNFSFVTSVMENGVKHYNACVQAFNAQIIRYKELAAIYAGNITRQEIIIQELQSRLSISQSMGQYNSAVLTRLQAQITSQKGVIGFFQSQMSLAKAQLKVELIQAEIDRLEIQIFAELSRAAVDRLRQDIAEQEAEISKARLIKLDAIKERLLAEIEISQVELDTAKAKFAGDREAFDITQGAKIDQHTIFPREVTAREKLFNRQILTDEARGNLMRSTSLAQLDEILLREQRLIRRYQSEVDQAEATSAIDKLITDNSTALAKSKVDARTFVKDAEIAAQRLLAKSDITQSLIHELAAG